MASTRKRGAIVSTVYRVWARDSGVLQWEGRGWTPKGAMDQFAREVGSDLADLPDLLIEEVGGSHELVWSSRSSSWIVQPAWFASREVPS